MIKMEGGMYKGMKAHVIQLDQITEGRKIRYQALEVTSGRRTRYYKTPLEAYNKLRKALKYKRDVTELPTYMRAALMLGRA